MSDSNTPLPRPGETIRASKFQPPGRGVDLPRPRLPWVPTIVAVAVLVVAWAAWFVLTARSVGIEIDPPFASVTVDEWPAPRVGNHWLLRQGPRRIIAEAEGYKRFDDEIKITGAQLQTHRILLERLPGQLRVSLDPQIDATLFIDGQSFAEVPGLVEQVPAGRHEFEIRAPRYLPFSTVIFVEGRSVEQSLNATLDPAWANVTLDSRPSQVEVTVDRQAVGVTPLSLELLAGRRVIELNHDGYKTWKQTLPIVAGKDVALGEIVLAKADGRFKIVTRPDGANVTINGEFVGRTPLETAVRPEKNHTVKLLREGYKVATVKQAVESGKLATVDIELSPELATIHFQTNPADAELLINGESRGTATQSLALPTHQHTVTVRREGYATYETRVTPRKGAEKRFKVRLKTLAESQGSGTASGRGSAGRGPSKGFVTSHAGQTLKLFTGGRVRLGSSRRTPGHRANEVEREVTLQRPFYLGVKEVSNAEYRRFLAAHDSGEFKSQSLNDDLQPAVMLTWESAVLYCNWLSRRDGLPPFYQIKYGEVLGINPAATGYRLPTEAEWEWAAKMPPSGAPSVYPWGDKFPPKGRSGNYADSSAASVMGDVITGYTDSFAVSAPVGSFSANLRGLHDMDGNVSEWVHDFYDAAPPTTVTVDPLGSSRGVQHVIKGGSWARGSESRLRYAYRDSGEKARDDVGFRIARYAQ